MTLSTRWELPREFSALQDRIHRMNRLFVSRTVPKLRKRHSLPPAMHRRHLPPGMIHQCEC
jgi:hypothetical protein